MHILAASVDVKTIKMEKSDHKNVKKKKVSRSPKVERIPPKGGGNLNKTGSLKFNQPVQNSALIAVELQSRGNVICYRKWENVGG